MMKHSRKTTTTTKRPIFSNHSNDSCSDNLSFKTTFLHTDMHTQTHTNPCMHTKSSERKIFSLPTYSTKISLTGEYAFHLCNYYNTRSSSKVTACFPGHVSKYGPNTIWICKKTKTTVIFLCLRAVMVVAFSSCARTWGEYLTIYSPPALFF